MSVGAITYNSNSISFVCAQIAAGMINDKPSDQEDETTTINGQ